MCNKSNPSTSSAADVNSGEVSRDGEVQRSTSKPEKKQEQNRTNDVSTNKTLFDRLPPTQQFILLALIMFFFFGIHNILQEAIMKIPEFSYGVMLGYMEVLGVTVCSFLERKYVAQEKGHIAPMSAYPMLTACLVASSAFSNMSLNYINFPTKVVFRSCKLIPTMIISTILNKRVFSSSEYVCAIAISLGLVLFAAADWKLAPSFNPFGLVLVSLSVIADAILPNAQERVFRTGASRLEVTLYTNAFTLISLTFTTLLSGDLIATLKLALVNKQLATFMTIYVMISYVAISTFMTIVRRYGGVTAVLLGTARKAMTIILSFLLFPKEFSWMYGAGATLVLGGLLVISLMKQINSRKGGNLSKSHDSTDDLEKGQPR